MDRGARAAAGRLAALALAGGALALAAASVPARAAEVALSFGDAPSGSAAGFRIERRKAQEPSFEVIALVGPGVADFIDRGLPAGSVYCYRVRASSADAASAWSPEVCAEARDASPPPPEPAAIAAPAPAEGATPPPGESGTTAPTEAPSDAPAASPPGSEPGRRIRTSGGWLQVLD